MQNSNFILYGTGAGARQVIQNTSFPIVAVVSPEKLDDGKFFHGIPLFYDDFLLNIKQCYSLIIASQYFDIIHNRLLQQGKLSNPCLKEILAPNLIGQRAPYDSENITPITKDEWNYLFSLFQDKNSLRLLNIIKKERLNSSYPSVRYIPLNEGIYHAGIEDYWRSVKPTQIYQKAIVIDAGAYIGDSISEIVINISGGYMNTLL